MNKIYLPLKTNWFKKIKQNLLPIRKKKLILMKDILQNQILWKNFKNKRKVSLKFKWRVGINLIYQLYRLLKKIWTHSLNLKTMRKIKKKKENRFMIKLVKDQIFWTQRNKKIFHLNKMLFLKLLKSYFLLNCHHFIKSL